MKKKNNLDISDNQVDALLIIGIVIIASTGYDGWGWLLLFLFLKQ